MKAHEDLGLRERKRGDGMNKKEIERREKMPEKTGPDPKYHRVGGQVKEDKEEKD